MKRIDKSFSAISKLSSPDAISDIDYRQISSFFYDQLIDAFVFFRAENPVDWSTVHSEGRRLSILAGSFRIFEINDALALQYGSDDGVLIGLTLGEFFGKKFRNNKSSWKRLIHEGEVFTEFVLEKRKDAVLWVEASYKLVKNARGSTIGILAVQRDITQRKLAFQAHEETEERLKRLAHLSFQAIVILNKGKIMDLNEALVKISGYDREELLNQKILAGCFPRKISQKIFRKNWEAAADSFETFLYRKNKTVVPVEMETQVITYNNEPTNVVGITDISNRKRIEEEIVKLSIALDQSANEIIITRKDGNIEYVNRSFTNVTGYLPSEVIGKNPRILKSGNHSPEFYKDLWMTLLNGKQWEGEFLNRKKNGDLYWETATITPIKNKEGEIVRYIAIKEDITRRKIAEQSLRDSEEKFRSMVSNIPGVVYRCAYDRDWTVYFLTDAIENLTGFQVREFIENPAVTFAGLIHPDDRRMVEESVKASISGSRQFNVEYRIITKKNAIRWVSNNGRPVYDEQDDIKWLDGFLLDITERIIVLEELKKAKIAAEEANNAKSEFLANISHEIRTPLNSVMGFTELMEGLTTDSMQIKYLNSIKASGKNLMMLINDLLDLSKIESGKMTLHYTFFDIRRLLDEIRNVFSLRIAIKGIGYHDELESHFPAEIKFDEIRLRQILINLVGNAVKFTHEGEIKIHIKAYAKQKNKNHRMKLEIKVADTGIGIPENSFRLIFESFRQHSQLNSRKYGGTGLGLAITKRLVEAMDGKITVDSQIGKGSTFTVTFPGVEFSDINSNSIVKSALPREKSRHDTYYDANMEGKTDKYILHDHVELNLIKNAEYHLLIMRFEQELTSQWRLYKKKQPLKEIRSFAREIISLGKSFKLGFIAEYGEQLLATIENFDIEEMRLKLELFPDLIKQLKRVGHEN
jgi:PAS domain S-box-containing protein